MRIRCLKLSNFRNVADGEVLFPAHTVIIGGNSVGKSTLCEALDLLLGPDRLARSSPIDEHDFFERRYLAGDGVPILVELEVVLTDLTEDVLTKYRIHLEYWNTATDEFRQEVQAEIVALKSRIDAMEGRVNGRPHALTSRIDSVNSRINALRQVLFSHKDPAAWPGPATVPPK